MEEKYDPAPKSNLFPPVPANTDYLSVIQCNSLYQMGSYEDGCYYQQYLYAEINCSLLPFIYVTRLASKLSTSITFRNSISNG